MTGRWYETGHFYDRLAERLAAMKAEEIASLRAQPEPIDPEAIFTAEVQRRLRPDDTVLDIGTGDGEWLIANVGPRCRRAIGVDYAGRRLLQGAETRRPGTNVCLALGDGRALPVGAESVSILINRRGPLTADDVFLGEGYRALKRGGHVFEITIGEQNARELADDFGPRWQMYEAAKRGPQLHHLRNLYRAHGIEIGHSASLVASVYLRRDGLEFMLSTTPTLEAFDPLADARRVDAVAERYSTERGIRITMHRLLLFGEKPV